MQFPTSARAFFSVFILVIFVSAAVTTLAPQQASPTLVTQAVDNAARSELRGNVHPLALAEFDQGEVPPDLPMERMLMVIKRSPEQERALARLLEEQQDQNSPVYHKWLTPEEFGARFGPSESDLAVVTNWLRSSGFVVAGVSSGRTVIEFSGTAALVKQAFGTAIHRYSIQGVEHFANVTDPQIPTALVPIVSGIASLHNFPKQSQNKFLGTYSVNDRSLRPLPDFTFTSGGYNYYALVPYDFAIIYNLLPLWNAPSPINGQGQTIAIVGRTDIDPTDATTFWSLFGLDGTHAPQPTLVRTYNGPNPGVNGDEPEADIDIQWSGAAAPGATINFVTSASTDTTDGVDLSSLYIVDNNIAPVMSASYGLCEYYMGTAGVDFYGRLWQQAAAQGISVFVSSGDNGSAGCDYPGNPAQNGLHVNGLASTPYNVAVGGTDFNEYQKWTTYWNSSNNSVTHASAKGYIPETTWNDTCTNSLLKNLNGGSSDAETNCNNPNFYPFITSVAGSGGPSHDWLKPSWQTGTPADNARDLPDISLFSSDGFLGSFYVVCVKRFTGVCDLNNFAGFGGTSVASPAFAGIMSLVNQKWGIQGNPNFVLYKLPAKQATAIHDIPTGSTISVACYTNSADCVTKNLQHSYGVLSGFNTGTGYDLATGLGSVDAAVMVNNWNKVTFTPSTTVLTVNNGDPLTATHGDAVPIAVTVTPASPAASGDVALLASPGTPGNPGFDTFSLTNGSFDGTTKFLPGGNYSLIAHYAGDTRYGASYSDPVPITIAAEDSSTFMPGLVTGTDGNGNPIYATSVTYGSRYSLRADVKNSQGNFCNPPPTGDTACPTGNILFKDNGSPIDVGTFSLNRLGYAEDTAVQLAGGSHTLNAQYGGDGSFNPSSASQAVNVAQASPGMILSGGGWILVGQPVTLSGTVWTNSWGTAPTNAISFKVDGKPYQGSVQYTSQNGSYPYPYASLTGNISTSFDSPGSHSFTASYAGDGNYLDAPAPYEVPITVQYNPTYVTLTVDPTSVDYGGSVTLTATVGGATKDLAPTGSIMFSNAYGNITSPAYTTITDNNGNLALQAVATLTPDYTQTPYAIYFGDSNYRYATSNFVNVVIANSTFSFSPIADVSIGQAGGNGTASVTLTSSNGFNSSVVINCSLPNSMKEASCSSAYVYLSPNQSATAQVTITTTAPHQTADSRPWRLFGLAGGMAGILLIPRSRCRRRLLGVLLLVTVALIVSCGGGGGDGGGGGGGGHTDPGTPPGTYTVNLSATGAGITQNATFSVTVH